MGQEKKDNNNHSSEYKDKSQYIDEGRNLRDSEEAYQSQNDHKHQNQKQYQHVPTPTNKSIYIFQQKTKANNNASSASSQVNPKQKGGMYEEKQNKLGMNERNEANDLSQVQTSRFSLQSELPKLDTQELLSAQKWFRAQDANDTEIIEMDMSVHGLKTATQKSLI